VKKTIAALVLSSVAAAAAAQSTIADQRFVMRAAMADMFETREALAALDKANDPRLKDFARLMISDHANAENALQNAAKALGSTAPPMLDEARQAALDTLNNASGADFDKLYVADQVQAHAETVALLSDYRRNGSDPALKAWAETTLPTIKHHRAMIDAM
jgi:putative membrane protein